VIVLFKDIITIPFKEFDKPKKTLPNKIVKVLQTTYIANKAGDKPVVTTLLSNCSLFKKGWIF
jgi:hypothetical protein